MSTRTEAAAPPPATPAVSRPPEALSLALIATLPLGWQVTLTEVARHTNPLVLNGEEALENPVPEPDAHNEWRHRLDAKADLALAHAVLAHAEKPVLKPTPIELYSDHIRWVGASVEGSLEMWLQIHPLAPPLVLSVRAEGDYATFVGLTPETTEALERLIFRHHRRQIKARRDS